MIVSKVVEIKMSEKSFVYFDKLTDGTFRVAYTTDNAEVVRRMLDSEIAEKGKTSWTSDQEADTPQER